jgi:putative nucleotidyltransferase with HDIG domain
MAEQQRRVLPGTPSTNLLDLLGLHYSVSFEFRQPKIKMTTETLATRALEILHDWVQSESLRKHCYAVADSMKHFAELRHEDADLWEAVGLLHDMDYERHPNLERSPTEGHPFVGVAWLRENGWSEEVCRAILSHADYANVSCETLLEKTLYAVDELSSFIVAVALVRPTKSIHDVDVRAVKKKMKDKAFARAVNRDDILRGAEQLGTPLDTVIFEVITALTVDAKRLGLSGTTH